MEIKTIDINAKQWFDKVNLNSYFAGIVTVNFGMKDYKKIVMPFQDGHGSQYEQEAFKQLRENGFIPNETKSLSDYVRANKIIVRYNKQTGCKKSELKSMA